MKTRTARPLSRKGFTLVELLVVVAIIAVLAGLGLGVAKMAKDRANDVTAKAAIGKLGSAIDLYLDKYDELPLSEGETTDTEKRTDNELMGPLCGLESSKDQNPYQISFFEFKGAKGSGNDKYGGLDRSQTEAQLYGPWRTRNVNDRYYQVIFNYDYNDNIEVPTNLGSDTVYGVKFLIYSYGKDGKIGQENNQDNVYGWK
ncbi:type II secretion system GspH family protein [Akkermansiaceae bacterium]|nr:type II secretion system GspH family protein [Akkermansiaceae bacterium]MDB4288422.1 type II secretion system GspH family protein [bacterium]MDA7876487.1 type II secretion system GspH family protein [Akkermansiaceae bacterium]MDA8975425.1 type II secretion system GspH family protein [Akkermansiaceae bacterium]MDB0056170.1 type II secretion system GspH family protein [Akkermansiaceae bacterium]